MKITGTLKVIMETEQKSEKFSVREFVVEYKENPLYPQMIKFQLVNDKCAIMDHYTEGQEIEVSFNLRGREYNGKYYNSLEAWKVSA